MDFRNRAIHYRNAEAMAEDFLKEYYANRTIHYPVSPFAMLKDAGVLFQLMDFHKLEGVYIPDDNDGNPPIVGINVNRPVTRQRYTAAHELCHHYRDFYRRISCPISGNKDKIEKFADEFAAAVLMPLSELRKQVDKRRNPYSFVDFDSVLEIAEFFGVSFESCLYRIAWRLHAIDGDTASGSLKKRIKTYSPENQRLARGMTHSDLYVDLIHYYQNELHFVDNDFNYAKYLFQNDYIYNDSRMEGLEITQEQAAEIVTDLRLHTQNSDYCNENSEAFMSIAGHYAMYQDVFTFPFKNSISVFDMLSLNRKLFSCYLSPDFGGVIRQSNTLVLGAKFETADYHDILRLLSELDLEIKEYYERRHEIPASEYIKHVARVHHRITVIHPFSDGNGRTSRAFMNMQLVRAGLPPIYILAKEKRLYIQALLRADKDSSFNELYEIIFRSLLRCRTMLNRRLDS